MQRGLIPTPRTDDGWTFRRLTFTQNMGGIASSVPEMTQLATVDAICSNSSLKKLRLYFTEDYVSYVYYVFSPSTKGLRTGTTRPRPPPSASALHP